MKIQNTCRCCHRWIMGWPMSKFCLSKTFNTCTKEMRPKRNSGRPKKARHAKRDKCVTSSYTQGEYEQLIQKAHEADLPPSILQRDASLKAKITARNSDAGFRLSILQDILKHARYCRAELHKMERHISEGQYADSPPIPSARLMELCDMVEEKIALITHLMRREVGL